MSRVAKLRPFFFSSHIIDIRQASDHVFFIVSSASRRDATRRDVPADVDEPLLPVIPGERRKSLPALRKEGSASIRVLCVWRASRVPQRPVFRWREFLIREGPSVKFAPFVRPLPACPDGNGRKASKLVESLERVRCTIENQIQSVAPLNYTECLSLREKRGSRPVAIRRESF